MRSCVRIIVDAMGGDNAPEAIVKGALSVHGQGGVEIILAGREEEILAAAGGSVPAGVQVVDAREVIEICDDPATAFKRKKDSSVTVGLTMLKNGEGDAFVSAGSTGALLSAATLIVKRVRGIRRAALCPVIPTATGRAVLIDCGANAECTAEYLTQFAYLGSFYARRVLGVKRPRVGLLNIGAEPSKGDALRHETYPILQAAGERGELNFIGNIEAKEAILGGCDVIVSDGFAGNIMLKSIEGVGSFLGREVKGMFLRSGLSKMCALLMKGSLRTFKEKIDPDTIGGTAFIGISKPVIKAHGSSGERAIAQAVRQAAAVARSDIIADIEANVSRMHPSAEQL